MTHIFIEAAKRTPIGAFQGALSSFKAWQLGACAIGALPTQQVTEVFMGCVLQAGQGQAPARQAALSARVAESVPCTTINKVCGSGMQAIMAACDQLLLGHHTHVLAGGMESMSNAPYLLDKVRNGLRFGHSKVLDHMVTDGLEDAYTKMAMGGLAEIMAEKYGFTRENQEAYVIQTYENWQSAHKNSRFSQEISPVYMDVKSDKVAITTDEPPQKVILEKFKNLKPAFKDKGSITAATASSLADGAAALLLCAEKNAVSPLARVAGYVSFAQNPAWFTLAPIQAIEKLCTQLGWHVADVDLFEINEAFAVVPMAAMKDLEIPRHKVNIHGGACVLGHPLGASGARVVVTLAHALKNHGLRRGIATVCIGSGEATAIALECVE
jgi:acetyl-CoA C-acetyltransferase